MSDDRSGSIRDRAYEIWQAEGEPHGRDQEHWTQAERELNEGEEGEAAHAAEAGDGADASRPSDADRAA